MPLLPAHSASHTSSTLSPSEVMTPRPVTTTRRRLIVGGVASIQNPVASRMRRTRITTGFWLLTTGYSLTGVVLDVVDGLTHRLDLLGLFVGDRQLELVLELHYEFYGVERIGVQVVDEVGLARDLALVHTHLLADDFNDLLLDVFHVSSTYPAIVRTRSRRPRGPGVAPQTIAVAPCFATSTGCYITMPPSTQITCPVT